MPDEPIVLGSDEQFTMDEFAAAAADWEYRDDESDSEDVVM